MAENRAAATVADGVPVVELRGIARTYRGRGGAPIDAVRDVSLSVDAGEIFGLVGRSGAGKSTIGRLILGLERPDSGEMFFEGRSLAELSRADLKLVRRRMQLLQQDPFDALHPGMRLAAAVAEPLVIAGVARAVRTQRAADALESVGLTPAELFLSRYPDELSGGQRQRVAIARALVARPRLLVADEPTSMLDASLRAGILDLISALRDSLGTAVLFITHDLALARHVCDRIGVVDGGRLVEVGAPDALIDSPQHPATEQLLAAAELISTHRRKT